jgi:hypothetical protein
MKAVAPSNKYAVLGIFRRVARPSFLPIRNKYEKGTASAETDGPPLDLEDCLLTRRIRLAIDLTGDGHFGGAITSQHCQSPWREGDIDAAAIGQIELGHWRSLSQPRGSDASDNTAA